MKRRVLVSAALAAALACAAGLSLAAPSAEILSVQERASGVSAARIHEAVKQAAALRKWGIKADEPGRMLLVYPTNNRSLQYQATVSVTYGEGFYKVEYVSSRGLNEQLNCRGRQGVVCAHRNVNRWIANLGKDLKRLLMQ